MAEKDAIALLKADHRKVEELFAQFEKAEDDEAKRDLAEQICTELVVHATIEEEFLYPALSGTIDEDMVNEAYVEHDGAKVLIAEIAEGGPEDSFYAAKVKVLSELIKHHVAEEEQSEGLFDQAKEADIDLVAIGEQMAERKAELLEEIESDGLPDPETRSYTGHTLVQGEPVESQNAT